MDISDSVRVGHRVACMCIAVVAPSSASLYILPIIHLFSLKLVEANCLRVKNGWVYA